MTIIHLKRYYPYMTKDVTLEVSDEIAAAKSAETVNAPWTAPPALRTMYSTAP